MLYKNFKTVLVALSLSIFVMQADATAQNANSHSLDTEITAVTPTTTSIKNVQTSNSISSFLDYFLDFSNLSTWLWGDSQSDETFSRDPLGDWEWDELDDIGGN
ncbi:MAG: hypothetical protein ACPG5B_03120 [Chitinophagales bacterium]